MRTLLYLVFFLATTPAGSEIKVPVPPTPPSLPKLEAMIAATPTQQEKDTYTIAITRLDSVSSKIDDLKSAINELEKVQTEIRAELPPPTRLNRVYLQSEVDQKAFPIRRSLGPAATTANISLRLIINPEGKPEELEFVSAPPSQQAALTQAVSSWLFAPARKSGRRVSVRTSMTIRMDED